MSSCDYVTSRDKCDTTWLFFAHHWYFYQNLKQLAAMIMWQLDITVVCHHMALLYPSLVLLSEPIEKLAAMIMWQVESSVPPHVLFVPKLCKYNYL